MPSIGPQTLVRRNLYKCLSRKGIYTLDSWNFCKSTPTFWDLKRWSSLLLAAWGDSRANPVQQSQMYVEFEVPPIDPHTFVGKGLYDCLKRTRIYTLHSWNFCISTPIFENWDDNLSTLRLPTRWANSRAGLIWANSSVKNVCRVGSDPSRATWFSPKRTLNLFLNRNKYQWKPHSILPRYASFWQSLLSWILVDEKRHCARIGNNACKSRTLILEFNLEARIG